MGRFPEKPKIDPVIQQSLRFRVVEIPYQQNLDSGFQSLVGFRILCTEQWTPTPRIPDSADPDPISKHFTDSGIWITLHGAISKVLNV